MCFEALSWPVLYDRVYRHHSLACRSRPAALLVVEGWCLESRPHSPGLTALLATLEIGLSAGSASYSLLLASRGSTNSRTPPASEFGWAVPLARACVRPAGARATISTPSPIAVMLGGAMQEETTGMPNT